MPRAFECSIITLFLVHLFLLPTTVIGFVTQTDRPGLILVNDSSYRKIM